jgi:hypothetical protein
VTVLLPTDTVELYPASAGDDAHGWADPGAAPPAWSGLGSLQLGAGASDARAADAGGAGPFDPAKVAAGVLYLPPEAAAADGMVAVIRGDTYVLAQVRYVADPIGAGLDCLVATATGTATWPGGVA